MAKSHLVGTFETCAGIRTSQSVDLDHCVAVGSALPKVPSRLTSARALGRFLIDTKNCPF